MSNPYKAGVALMIEMRAADVDRLGALGAIAFWIENARTETGPSWRRQEQAVLEVLSEHDTAQLDRLYPTKTQETAA